MSEVFEGFPQATFQFLKQLKSNNNREWFNDNKARYLNDVLKPSLLLIEAIGPKLKKISPHFTAVAKRSGGSLMRVYRDTRFSKDKTPYKTNIGIQLRHEFGKDVHAPGFYIHIAPAESFFGAGIWHPENAVLRQIRNHIVENEGEWSRIRKTKKIKERFELAGDSLKRPPQGISADHPLIEDLKRKDFILVGSLAKSILGKRGLIDQIESDMKAVKRHLRFLCDALKLPL